MKWKQGRQSKNVIDRTMDPPVEIPDGEKLVDGTIYRSPDNGKGPRIDKKEIEVMRELGKHNINKTTPIPTPRPNIIKTQVTPGKWITK